MTRDEARRQIREQWEPIIRTVTNPAKKGQGQYICPLCGHGKGGDGLRINPHSKTPGGLKCFGACGFSGDIIDLVMKTDGLQYSDALYKCADIVGLTIENGPQDARRAPQSREQARGQGTPADKGKTPETALNAPEQPERTADYLGDRQKVADYMAYYDECRARLEDPAAISYLQARGISKETAGIYGVGYDPAWISPTVIKQQAAKGSAWRPPATPRIIIPVSNNHYIARATDPAIKDYAKMNETGGGDIGIFRINEFYNSHNDYVFITEGAFDALSIFEVGAAAVALNSTSNAGKLIERLEEKPTKATAIICLDSDEAGRKAADVLAAGLARLNVKCIKANVSCGYKDPNEALVKNPAAFRQAIQNAKETRPQEVPEQMDALNAFFEKIQSEAYRPYSTGLKFFDDMLSGGPIRQTVLLLLAAPGAGKTTLCQQIAEQMARNKKPVIYFNLEMSGEQMLAKAISNNLMRDGVRMSALQVMQGYKWTDAQRQTVKRALSIYRRDVFPYLQYNPGNVGNDIDDISKYLEEVGRAAKDAGKEAPVIVIDYLHLITDRERTETQELIKKSIKCMKDYAIKYDTVVICIAAINRESSKSGRVTLESGRDSSGLEFTADYQLSLNYYDLYTGAVAATDAEKIDDLKRAEVRKMLLKVDKSRFYATGNKTTVYFYAAYNTFYGENEFRPADGKTPFDEKDTKRKPVKRI